jgi:hypothetical protein
MIGSATMIDEPFQPEDLRLINLVLLHYPDVSDVIRAVKHAVARVTYPVRTVDELADALGGLTIAGGAFSLADAERLLPPYYFPILSEEDLVVKVADLRAQAAGLSAMPVQDDVTWIKPVEAAPGDSLPPAVSPEDVPSSAGCSGMKLPPTETSPS